MSPEQCQRNHVPLGAKLGLHTVSTRKKAFIAIFVTVCIKFCIKMDNDKLNSSLPVSLCVSSSLNGCSCVGEHLCKCVNLTGV